MKYTLGSIGVALDKGRFVGRRLALLQFEHGLTQIRELPSAELLEPLDVLFPHIFVVSGGPGHGKSALLRQFELVARADPENEPVLVAVDLSAEPGLPGPLDLLQVLHDALFQLGFEAEFEAFRDVVARRVEIVRQLDDAQRAYITLLSARQSDAIDALRGGRLDAPALASWLLGREDLEDSRDPFIQHLRRRMSAEDWELLTDPAQIAASFVEATNAIARRDRPLVLLVELETGGEQRLDWLRRWVLPETGLHTLWVLAGDFDANQINSMRDDFVEEMLARVPLEPLSRLEVSSYLRQYSPRPGAAPNRAFVRAVQQISKGMPLAVEVLAYLHKAGVDVKNVFDELRATDAPLGERLHAFLALFVELGVVSTGRAASSNGEADRRRLWLYCVALLRRFDPAVLGVMLTAAGQDADAEAVRAELKEAYPFLFGASRNSVHPLVREILRGCFWSDEPDDSQSRAARAAAGFYRQRLDEIGADHDVGQRHELVAWREATLDYVSALFWAAPAGEQSCGAFFRALIEAAVFHRSLASDLLAVAALHAEHDAELGEHCDRVAALLAQAAPEPGDPRAALASLEALAVRAEQWEFTPLHHALLALLKAQRLVAAGRAGEAIDVLRGAAAPELQSRTAALLSQIGWQAVRMGGETALDEARRAFEAAAGCAPHAGDPLLGQGAVQFAARDFEAAQEQVRRAIDVGGERDHALIWLGHVNYAAGHYGKATSAFQQAVELQPRSPDAHAGAGYVLLRLGHPQDAQAAFERAIEYDDEYAIAHNGLGDAVAELGDRARAENAYRRAIDLDEHYALPHKGLGSLMLSFGRHEQAQAQYEAAIALGGLDALQLAEAHNGLGMAHFHQGRYAESMTSYQYAIELAPDHAPSHVGLGQVLLHLGRHAEALAACERGIELDPRFAFGHYTLGDIYRAQGQPKAAIVAYERAVAEDPDYAAPYTGLGSLYAELERYPDAISAFQRAFNLSGLNEYELALAHKGLGAVYQEQGNVAEAIGAYRRALELNVLDDRNRALTFSALGDLHRGSAQYEEAIEAYQQAVDVGVLSGSELARVHSGLGTAHRAQNRPDEALVSYRLAMVLDPKYAYPHNGLGNIHYVRGEFEEAIHAYQRAIELDSEYAHPYNGLGNVFADLGRHTEAVQSYQRAIETGGVDNHELAIFYNGLGNSYADQGELEPAIEAYLRAVELDREYAFPHSGLGSAYADLGNYESALEAFQHAVELGGLGDRELAVVYSGIGNVQHDLGDYQSAIENYQQAIVLHPKDPAPHTGLAIACRAVGEYEAAFAAYQRAIQLGGLNDHDLAVVYSGLGGVYAATDRYGQAVTAFERAIDRGVLAGSELAIVLTDLGESRLALDQYAEAMEAFERAVEVDNLYAAAHIGLGAAGLQLGRLDEALSACNWAVELEPENRRAHTGLGEVFLARRQYAEAERAFQRAIELDPGAAAAFGGLGAAHLANGQLPAAMAAYDRAAELEPDHPKHWSGRAHVLAAQGKFEDAHAAYRHAIGLGGLVGSDLAVAYNGFGTVCRVLGRPDEAVEAYQQAIVLDPSYAVPHSGLGVVFMEQGRYEEAQSALQRALKLGELEPDDAARAHFNLGKVLTLMDHTREARAEYERAVEQSPAFAAAHIALAGGYRRQGKNGPFTKAIDQARSVTDDGNEYDRAVLEALCDQVDEALDLLDAALQHKQTTVAWARRDPDLSVVRDNPRFEAIVQEYVL